MPARLGDSDTRVLSPEFLLLHVCSHLAFNHTFLFSVRALCDIAQVIRSCPNLDWETVVREGRLHGWREGVAMALRLSRDHVGAEVPAEALGALGGNELEAEILADALQQVFEVSGIPGELLTAPNLLAVHGLAGAPAKAAAIWKRVFVPRDELSMLYGVPRQDARLPLYYGTRIRDLLRRYAASGWALNVSDRRLGATAARHERLVRRLTRA